MGLAELRDRYFFEISADLQRMCLLARAMAEIRDFGLIYVTHHAEELPSCIDHHFEIG